MICKLMKFIWYYYEIKKMFKLVLIFTTHDIKYSDWIKIVDKNMVFL